MSLTVSFQSPDWHHERNPGVNFRTKGPEFEVTGFDLDHGVVTVYPRNEAPDLNLTLAKAAPYMNEDGHECGEIGWVIEPDGELLDYMPEIRPFIGQRWGRVLVGPSATPWIAS
jgi:hypothetical protein